MLDYKYQNADYYGWIYEIATYVQTNYAAEVVLTSSDNSFVYTYKNNKIEVDGAHPPRDKLYILLHEVGHLCRMMENIEDSTFFMDKSGDKNMVEKTMTVMEEVLAWHKAEEIAERLNIPIEKRAWQRMVNKTVEKYIGWASIERKI